MPAPGQRAKLVNAIDNQMSDEMGLEPLYRIEVAVALSPKGVKAGAIVVFRLNTVDLDFEAKLNPHKYDPHAVARAREVQDHVNKQTEVMFNDPEYFKETEGRWLPWALDRALALFDRLHGNASITLKCPQLKIRRVRSPASVAKLRSTPRALFPEVKDIDDLLERGYRYDPWSKKVRRGRISAEMSKR